MVFRITSDNLQQLPDIAKKILQYCYPKKKFLLYGDMGVGKTTLIKELSLQLGVQNIVNSPTFSIVNEYVTLMNQKVFHFDFYRLNHEQEAFDMGYEEYFFGDHYCFIEWPEKIDSLTDDSMVKIKMKLNGVKRDIEIII
ncbi:MAG: tRNA (adenosine(37)-N6)-threonylcarbamoyltransferase complex ATPase subunit type 1 TsaE [Flavobacteriales bacterium]|nr:tRNA (adenosine(37)-N6)-threonylcarbamoyltransferase complex ATPase subunit type 1 TsaE [Flavobacteriales bacterium]|tara:strand:- start:32722 stop:33141 length:420 start_codon:yes stop_codon:yes gene_type:complete